MRGATAIQSSWRRVLESFSSQAPQRVEEADAPADLLAGRYHVLNKLGSGGMGTVYRALDRLNGRVITLKRLRMRDAPPTSVASVDDARLDLAREFSLLASLRHPNIISVLNYGFDAESMPFFTMDLEENAVTIIEAGRGRALAVQVDILVQTLRALTYLHRHNILHCDLKPDNVVVVAGQVKVLDFGLSAHVDSFDPSGAIWIGTLPYMAPEILRGEPITVRTDLYAFGMIAYELLSGDYPFDMSDLLALKTHIIETALPRADDEIDERLRPWLARLLAKQPDERYGSATEVVQALATALGQDLALETVATRESFLQAAPFIGRREEISRMTRAMEDARQGSGGAWLVGGESGVGKSRLLDEIRIQALVRGLTVLRGQARHQGGAPYHPWHDVVSAAALRTSLSDDDVAVLRAIVPDLPRLLGRDIRDAPPVSPESTQTRLLLAAEELFRAQGGTVLVVLEDLHWAGSESLRLLASLAHAAPAIRLLLVASYRNDERPELPQAVEEASVLQLNRLAPEEIEALGVAMIGETARSPELLALLVRETEGIPFFLVEVVRALAESAAGLDDIGSRPLPERVLSGDMRRMVRRRLSRVPEGALPALRTAAVRGRAIDTQVLQRTHPDLDLPSWTAQCMAAAVLELRDQSWRFAHDKLREQLLEDLSPAVLRGLHRRVAEALEKTTPVPDHVVMALAHHWREAGDLDREAQYDFRAGILALESGACRESVDHLTRTLELVRGQEGTAGSELGWFARWRPRLDPNSRVDPDALTFLQGVIEGGLTDAYFRLGDFGRARDHGIRALQLFGYDVPAGRVRTILAIAGQVGLRGAQRLLRVRSTDPSRARRATKPVAQVLMRLIDTYFYSIEGAPLAWSILRMINETAPAEASPELARAYTLGALLAGMLSAKRLGEAWLRRAVEIVEGAGTGADRGWVLARVAVFRLSFAEWEPAAAAAARACVLAREVGDLRSFEESKAMSGLLELYRSRYAVAVDHCQEAASTALRSGNVQIRVSTSVIQAEALVRMGRFDEALPLCHKTLAYYESAGQLTVRSELVTALAVHAAACLRAEDIEGALLSATRAATIMRTTAPVTYWMHSAVTHTLETLVTLFESATPAKGRHPPEQIRGVMRAARQYARLFPIGRPRVPLAGGTLAWIAGRRRTAMARWRRALALATRLQMPYETGCAHAELGRHLPSGSPEQWQHLAAAANIFGQIDCQWELAKVRALQDDMGTAAARTVQAP